MTSYKAHASVIFTDTDGQKIDTFVISDTDPYTGLTHINHENLKVQPNRLELHAKTVCSYHLPIADAFSFELLKKLGDKFANIDAKKKVVVKPVSEMYLLSKAS